MNEALDMNEKTFDTDRGAIHYWIDTSAGRGPVLVFLPGLSADHRLFERQTKAFRGKYNFLVWDPPGHGASRPFRLDLSLDDVAVYLHEILQNEGMREVVLLGQSMGGYVSQRYLSLFPGEARGFISIDSAPLERKYMTAAEIWLLKRMEPIYLAFPWKLLIKSGARGCAETEYGCTLMEQMLSGYKRREFCALAGWGYGALAKAVESERPTERSCPILLLCGERDKAGSVRRYNRAWSKSERLPLVWVRHAGHNSNTDNPVMVNQLIETFVQELKKQNGRKA